jgi:hypothetical protein
MPRRNFFLQRALMDGMVVIADGWIFWNRWRTQKKDFEAKIFLQKSLTMTTTFSWTWMQGVFDFGKQSVM